MWEATYNTVSAHFKNKFGFYQTAVALKRKKKAYAAVCQCQQCFCVQPHFSQLLANDKSHTSDQSSHSFSACLRNARSHWKTFLLRAAHCLGLIKGNKVRIATAVASTGPSKCPATHQRLVVFASLGCDHGNQQQGLVCGLVRNAQSLTQRPKIKSTVS